MTNTRQKVRRHHGRGPANLWWRGWAGSGLRFAVVVIALLVLFFLLLTRVPAFDRHFIVPYTALLAGLSASALNLLGFNVHAAGNMIGSQDFSIDIRPVCNGLEVLAIYCATVIAFPARWKNKVIGIALGVVCVYAINLARIIVLFWIGTRNRTAFNDAHTYYAQAFVVLATVGLWLLWVAMFSDYGTSRRREVSP